MFGGKILEIIQDKRLQQDRSNLFRNRFACRDNRAAHPGNGGRQGRGRDASVIDEQDSHTAQLFPIGIGGVFGHGSMIAKSRTGIQHFGTPGGIRTPGPNLRKVVLWSTELRA